MHCKELLAIFSLVSFSLIGLSFGNKIHQITEARSAPCNLTSFLIADERELLRQEYTNSVSDFPKKSLTLIRQITKAGTAPCDLTS